MSALLPLLLLVQVRVRSLEDKGRRRDGGVVLLVGVVVAQKAVTSGACGANCEVGEMLFCSSASAIRASS